MRKSWRWEPWFKLCPGCLSAFHVSLWVVIEWICCAVTVAAVVVPVLCAPPCLHTVSAGWTLMECCSVPPLSSAPVSASPSPLPPRLRLALFLPFSLLPFVSVPSSLPPLPSPPLSSLSFLSLFSCLSVSLPQVWPLLWLVLRAERWLTVWLSFWLPWCLSAPLAAPGLPPQAPCWGSCPTRGVKAQAPAHGGHAAPGTPPDPPAREPPRTTRKTRRPSDPSGPTLYPPTSTCAPEFLTPPPHEWCSVLVCTVHSWGRRVDIWLWHSLDVSCVCIFCSSCGERVQNEPLHDTRLEALQRFISVPFSESAALPRTDGCSQTSCSMNVRLKKKNSIWIGYSPVLHACVNFHHGLLFLLTGASIQTDLGT